MGFALVTGLMLGSPAVAWEAGIEGAICTLTHAEDGAEVRLTFDPSVPLYTITLTGAEPWPVAPDFSMVFNGPRGNAISTTAHVLSPDRLSLSVADRGFGNVLDGLQYNDLALGISGDVVVTVSLEGAAPEVEAFRACGTMPTA
jgi:hypothetical protein